MSLHAPPCLPEELTDHFPRIDWLAKQALVAQAEAERLTQRLAELGCLTPAGPISRLPYIAELQAALGAREARADRAWQEVTRLGGRVADRRIGFVDFLVVVERREVALCWQPGEPTVLFWHGRSEPCRARCPLATLARSSSDP